MKRNRKSVVFIVMLLILCFAYAALFGVYNYYGDIPTTYFKGAAEAGEITCDFEIDGGVEAIFKPQKKNNVAITNEDVDAAKQMLSERISYYKLQNPSLFPLSEIEADYTNKQVVVRLLYTDEVSTLANQSSTQTTGLTVALDSVHEIAPKYSKVVFDAMPLAGLIALAVILVVFVALYRVAGFVSSVAVLGQFAGIVACVTGFFSPFNGFVLTVPFIAGAILSIGMGVGSSAFINERIKAELCKGKTVEGAVKAGYKNTWPALLEGNGIAIIVAVVLMLAGGTAANNPLFTFGAALLVGAIWNLVMIAGLSRAMMTSLVANKAFRNPKLYGGVKNVK